MQPTTSYCPPTTSPGCSLGVNENGVPHFAQKPSARPGRPGRARPTFSPQAEQKRFSSGTSGLASTTDRGSGTGADGTVVMPAPRCWVSAVDATRRRVGRVVPLRAEPIGVLDNFSEMPVTRALVEARELPDAPDGGSPVAWGCAGAPQMLQYPSSISPAQPGSWQWPSLTITPCSQ